MTDYEKIKYWHEICVNHGWSQENGLKALVGNLVEFTPAGSAIPQDVYTMSKNTLHLTLEDDENPSEFFASLIQEYLCGILLLTSRKDEDYMWNFINDWFNDHDGLDIPEFLFPSGVRKVR